MLRLEYSHILQPVEEPVGTGLINSRGFAVINQNNFGDRLRVAREEAGLSLKVAAQNAGYSAGAVIERCLRRNASSPLTPTYTFPAASTVTLEGSAPAGTIARCHS